ncbi:photosystem II reaction center X protein [Prochlorococcus sp. AH-716-A06]|nr:photosystem II reaction center X protein [Prochlorococcus sp. AH-716-A06]
MIQISNLILAADVSPEVASSSGFNMIASFFAAALLIVIPAAAFLIFVSQKDSLERTSATRRR